MPSSVGGLASGLNTTEIINSMLTAERANRTRLEARQNTFQSQLSVWQDLNAKIGGLRSAAEPFAANAGAGAAVATASSSDDSLVAVKAGGAAPDSSFTFRVKQLAAAQQVMASGFANTTDLVGAGKALVATGLGQVGLSVVDVPSSSVGRYEIEVRAISGGSATVLFNGHQQSVSSGGMVTLTDGAGNYTTFNLTELKVGKASIGVVQTTATTTLTELGGMINTLGVAVSANAINKNDGSENPAGLVLSAREAGTAGAISWNFSGLDGVAGKTFDTLRAAADAQLVLADGTTTITRSSNRITDLVPGVTLDLQKADPTKDVTVTVAQDQQKIIDAGKAVIDALNTVLALMKKHTVQDPATNNKGPLAGDSRARRLTDSLMSTMRYSDRGQEMQVLAEVGITLSRDGTYKLDEAKLRTALTADHTGTMRLLSGDGADRKGVFGTMADTAKGLVASKGTVEGAIGATRQSIASFTSRLAAEDQRLKLVETRIRRQYTNLETTMAQLNSQANGLTSALSA
ncbi:MAG: flagellar filament capping protein FliD [Acidimicrobiales bacterium]